MLVSMYVCVYTCVCLSLSAGVSAHVCMYLWIYVCVSSIKFVSLACMTQKVQNEKMILYLYPFVHMYLYHVRQKLKNVEFLKN